MRVFEAGGKRPPTIGANRPHYRALSIYPFLFTVLLFSSNALAQQPDVQVKLDLVPTLTSTLKGPNAFQWYDLLGHYSTVGLSATFEQGYHAYLSERLETIPGNSDAEQLDEYYFEDPGIWRLGKQYLPFGRQLMLREDALAARADSRLLLKGIPLSVAVCDNGDKGATGAVARVGSTFGLSIAEGHHFGEEATDFTLFRRPGDSPGPGRGYQTIVDGDFSRHLGMYTLTAEFAALRGGETALDKSTDLSDLNLTIQPSKYQAIILGWSRDFGGGANFFRAQGRIWITKGLTFEPIVRMKDNNFYDLGLTLHVRM